MNRQCETCEFWDKMPKEYSKQMGKRIGRCHRNAPNLVYLRWKEGIKPEEQYPYFPIMATDDWCGEYSPLEKEKKWWHFWG